VPKRQNSKPSAEYSKIVSSDIQYYKILSNQIKLQLNKSQTIRFILFFKATTNTLTNIQFKAIHV